MKNTFRVALALAVLVAAQLACNMPTADGQGTALPAPNQTLTALFAFTPGPETGTPEVETTEPGGAEATATTAPAASNPTATATRAPSTGTNPTATATRAAAQNTSAPLIRPRSAVVARYLNTPPTLDGDWSEWKDITEEYPANTLVYGRDNWTGQEDLAGSFHIGWDEDYLYIAVKVRDDTYVQNGVGEDLYMGDSIEILFDRLLEDDFYVASLSPDDFQLGISPGRPDPAGTREAFLWLPADVQGPRTNVTIASRLETAQYRVEAAIPWNVLETTPEAGRHYGFAISVSDNDQGGKNEQQSMVSNVGTRRLTDPTSWGDLLLRR